MQHHSISNRGRFKSIDQLRGLVMVLMALDHTRWFFTNLTYNPEELAQTDIWLFLTRWVTHFCAPGFFLVAGMGIFLYADKVQNKQLLARYLLSRGALLVLLELTIVGFSWEFTPFYSFGGVIWALGWSFILMTGLIYLPEKLLLFLSASVLILHNNLDGITIDGPGWSLFFWRMFYQPGVTDNYFILFPIIPWLAVMVLGFVSGPLFLKPSALRKRVFIVMGMGFVVTFLILRLSGFYASSDFLFLSQTTSGIFNIQPETSKTLIALLNTEKYPPSLPFLLMTLGPIFLWLGFSKADRPNRKPGFLDKAMTLFGRVPLFYYLLHLYLIHLLAIFLGLVASQPVDWLLIGGPRTHGSGFALPIVYVAWIIAVGLLYPLCKWYEHYKRNHDYHWLRYL